MDAETQYWKEDADRLNDMAAKAKKMGIVIDVSGDKGEEESEDDEDEEGPIGNAFCATGIGGGVDSHCPPTRKGATPPPARKSENYVSEEALKAAQELAQKKAAEAPKPSKEEVAKANEEIDKKGADRYEADIRDGTPQRRSSRAKLLQEFGNGEECPCCYCGKVLNDSTITRDKIYTAREGGKYRHSNLVPACIGCNLSRGDTKFNHIKWT